MVNAGSCEECAHSLQAHARVGQQRAQRARGQAAGAAGARLLAQDARHGRLLQLVEEGLRAGACHAVTPGRFPCTLLAGALPE